MLINLHSVKCTISTNWILWELLYITRHSEISSMNRSIVADGLCSQRITLTRSSKYYSPWLHSYCHFCGSQDVWCPHSLRHCALWTSGGWSWLFVIQDFLTDNVLHVLLWAMQEKGTNKPLPFGQLLPCTLLGFTLWKKQLFAAETSHDGILFV